MSFPPSLSTRTIQGHFVTYPGGKPATGSLRIVLEDMMQGPNDDAIVSPFDILIPFDEHGNVSVVLPANNNPGWTPGVYRMYVYIGNSVHKQRLLVDYAGTAPIDLSDLLRVPSPTASPDSYVLLATKGAPGGVASLGSDGKVVSSQLPTSAGGAVSWQDILDRPAFYPSEPQVISWADIQGKPAAPTWSTIADKPTVFPPSTHTHDFADVTGKPSTYPPSTHGHATSDVSGLDAALTGKASTNALTNGLAGKSDTTHTHTTSQVSGLDAALTSKANASDLTTGLAGKADTSHVHAYSTITGKPSTFPHDPIDWSEIQNKPTVYPGAGDGSGSSNGVVDWVNITSKPSTFPSTPDDWSSVTNKPTTFSPTAHTHVWVDTTDKPITFPPSAHSHSYGSLSGIPASFVPAVHAHVIADTTNLQAALDDKATTIHTHAYSSLTGIPSTFVPTAHAHVTSDVSGLDSALAGKAAASHVHAYSSLTGIPSTFTPTTHAHAITDINNLTSTLSGKSDTTHTHVYSTLTGIPSTFAPSAHTHLWADTTDKPTTFTPSVHTHVISDVTSLQTSLNAKTNLVVGLYNVSDYGAKGDGTTDDTAAFNTALAAMPTKTISSTTFPVGRLVIPTGTFVLGTSVDVNNIGPFVSIQGTGKSSTFLDYRGAGSALRMFNSVRPSSDTFDTLAVWAGSIDGFTIKGNNCLAGASGLRYGDTEGGVIGPDLMISGFNKTGCDGMLFDNQYSWTENIRAALNVFDNTTGVRFHGTGGSTVWPNSFIGGDNSFMYNAMDFKVYSMANQNGVVLDGGASYLNGSLRIRANMANRSAVNPANALLTLTGVGTTGHLGAGTYSTIVNCHVEIQAESNGAGAYGPMTLRFGDPGSNYFVQNEGVLSFSGGKWTPSNWTLAGTYAIGSFIFSGQIAGDANLAPNNGGFTVRGSTYYGTSMMFNDGGTAMTQGDIFSPLVLDRNMTVALQNVRAGAQRKTFMIQQPATGGPFAVTWPQPASPSLASPAIYWAGGVSPVQSTAANALDVYHLTTADGIRWYGQAQQSKAPVTLATVATTGSYTDLTNKPTIPSGGTGSSAWTDITSKPDYLASRTDALRTWRAALANRHYSPAKIAILGDSISEGMGGGAFGRGWVPMALNQLRSRFPVTGVNGGEGFVASWDNPGVGAPPPYTYPVVMTPNNYTFVENGPGFSLKTWNLANTEAASYNFTGSSIHIWYIMKSGGATFSVTIDGVVVAATVASAGTAGRGLWTSAALTPGSHTITVRATSTGGLQLNGFRVFNGDEAKGIQMFNGSVSSRQAAEFVSLQSTAGAWADWVQLINPQLVVIELGLNDWGNNFTQAQFKANMKSIITRVRAVTTTDPSFVIYASPKVNSGAYTMTYTQLHTVWEQLASEDTKVCLFDVAARFLSPEDNPTAEGYYYDNGTTTLDIHPNDMGHSAVADAFVSFVSPS